MEKKTFSFDKIVRDNIEQILIQKGMCVHLKEAVDQATCMGYFKKKLLEEATEVTTAVQQEEYIEELADCLEAYIYCTRRNKYKGQPPPPLNYFLEEDIFPIFSKNSAQMGYQHPIEHDRQ